MATIIPFAQEDTASSTTPPDAVYAIDSATRGLQKNGYSNVTIKTVVIPISGNRPVQLGAFLKSPTNMSIKGALSLFDEEYEQIRDSIDEAMRNEALLRDLDVDAKNSTEQERKKFHDLISEYISAGVAENSYLVDKLTVRYRDVSPWLLYKFALLRRKKYKNMVKTNGLKEDSNDEHYTIDIGNPDVKEEDPPVASAVTESVNAKEEPEYLHGLSGIQSGRPFIQKDAGLFFRSPRGPVLRQPRFLPGLRMLTLNTNNGPNSGGNTVPENQVQGGDSATDKLATTNPIDSGHPSGTQALGQDQRATRDSCFRKITGLFWHVCTPRCAFICIPLCMIVGSIIVATISVKFISGY
ncbi:hypothetical protein TWF679_002265 [Orbilia oligospora]|uniref:Uncharacterized protein n=1 Tax=Orbilia oligospora TaxID=2813651 RepID=A0A8H8VGC1_ORBOL|nr:hypothetical protein TWF679_002265 [Orbilia oligospora]